MPVRDVKLVLWESLSEEGDNWLLESDKAACTFDKYGQLCFSTKVQLDYGSDLLTEAYQIMKEIFQEVGNG